VPNVLAPLDPIFALNHERAQRDDHSVPGVELGLRFFPLQEYGKHVWNVAKNNRIVEADVDAAREKVVTQLDENFFRVRIDRTTPAEKNYIVAMAYLGKGPYKTGDISTKLKKSTTTVAPLRGILINKGLIYSPSHGITDFTVPQFDDFLRRNFTFPVKSDT